MWHVVLINRGYGGDVAKTAQHLSWLPIYVEAALNYAAAFPDEIEAGIKDNDKGYEELKRILPTLELFGASRPLDTRHGEESSTAASTTSTAQ